MSEEVRDRNGSVYKGFNIGDDLAGVTFIVVRIVYLPLIVGTDTKDHKAQGVTVGAADADGAMPWFLDY